MVCEPSHLTVLNRTRPVGQRAVVGSAVSEAVADEPVQTDALLGGGEG